MSEEKINKKVKELDAIVKAGMQGRMDETRDLNF